MHNLLTKQSLFWYPSNKNCKPRNCCFSFCPNTQFANYDTGFPPIHNLPITKLLFFPKYRIWKLLNCFTQYTICQPRNCCFPPIHNLQTTTLSPPPPTKTLLICRCASEKVLHNYRRASTMKGASQSAIHHAFQANNKVLSWRIISHAPLSGNQNVPPVQLRPIAVVTNRLFATLTVRQKLLVSLRNWASPQEFRCYFWIYLCIGWHFEPWFFIFSYR